MVSYSWLKASIFDVFSPLSDIFQFMKTSGCRKEWHPVVSVLFMLVDDAVDFHRDHNVVDFYADFVDEQPPVREHLFVAYPISSNYCVEGRLVSQVGFQFLTVSFEGVLQVPDVSLCRVKAGEWGLLFAEFLQLLGITPDYVPKFDEKTFDEILQGILPVERGAEIQEWQKRNDATECPYVILDDLQDFYPDQQAHFVEIDSRVGITAEDVSRAIEILKN